MKTIRVKLIGATGYGGIGSIELLLGHPHVELVALIATSGTSQPISHAWPQLDGLLDMPLLPPDHADQDVDCDLVIYATPDGVAQQHAAAELEKSSAFGNRKVIDFSGDFRAADAAAYLEYAGRINRSTDHAAPELLAQAVYGLPELHREKIAQAHLVANPGCFAAGCILGLAPAVTAGLVDAERIICDAKSGVSGAGKKPKAAFHYPEQYENTFAYRLNGHQHVVEINHQLSARNGAPLAVTFTPQVVPMSRGILSVLYGKLTGGTNQAKVLATYRDTYADEPFVRVYGPDGPAGTGAVRGSNYCNLTVACDESTGTFRVISAIDNLMKGQAASAVQNMNVMFGLDERTGLERVGAHP